VDISGRAPAICFHVRMNDDARPAYDALLRAGGVMETGRLVSRYGRAAVNGMSALARIRTGPFLTFIEGTTDIARRIAGQRGGVVTCLSAAECHGIPVVGHPPRVIHLAVPHTRSRLRGGPATDGIRVHREFRPIGVDPARPWLADLPTVIGRLITCCSETQAIVALDDVLRRGLIAPGEIPIPARGPGSGRARRAADRASPRARSIMETLARLQLEDAGIGTIEVGAEIEGVGEVDLLVDGLIVVEIDGRQHDTDPGQVALDRQRDLALRRLGYIVLRFSTRQVLARIVAAVVREALDRFGRLPRPLRVPFTGRRVHAWDEEEQFARVEGPGWR
jgi:hypothetical protein